MDMSINLICCRRLELVSEQGQCVREWRNTTPICLFTWWRPWTIGWELLRNLCRYIMSNVPCHDAVLFVVLVYIYLYMCISIFCTNFQSHAHFLSTLQFINWVCYGFSSLVLWENLQYPFIPPEEIYVSYKDN